MHRFKALLRGSIVVTIGTLIGGFLSYLYSALMGRLLGPADFGDLGAINSYFVLITAVSGGLLTVTMYYTSALFAGQDRSGIARFYKKFSRIVFWGGLALTVLAILTAPIAAHIIRINDLRSLILALLSVVVTLLLIVNRGVLQGSQQFGQLTVSNIAEYSVKLVAAYLLVRFGLALAGATLAIPLGALGAYLLTTVRLRRDLGNEPVETKSELFPGRREVAIYFLPALASNFLLLFLMNLDILLVKRFFPAEMAGQYVAVSTIAKIIFYITGPITAVMFPLIAAQRSRGEKHYLTLAGALIITLVGSAVLLLLYRVFDVKIVTLLYGNLYRPLAGLLSYSSLLVIALSLVNLMSQYFLSIQRYWFILEMTATGIFLVIYSLVRHPVSVAAELHLLLGTFAVLLAVMVIDYLHLKRDQVSSLMSR